MKLPVWWGEGEAQGGWWRGGSAAVALAVALAVAGGGLFYFRIILHQSPAYQVY